MPNLAFNFASRWGLPQSERRWIQTLPFLLANHSGRRSIHCLRGILGWFSFWDLHLLLASAEQYWTLSFENSQAQVSSKSYPGQLWQWSWSLLVGWASSSMNWLCYERRDLSLSPCFGRCLSPPWTMTFGCGMGWLENSIRSRLNFFKAQLSRHLVFEALKSLCWPLGSSSKRGLNHCSCSCRWPVPIQVALWCLCVIAYST